VKSTFTPCALFCAALLCLTLPALAAASPTLSLRELLARHQKAAGAPTAAHDPTAHEIVYDVSAGGLAGTMTTYEAPPHRSRTEISLGPLAIVTGNDGKTSWEQDGTGNVRILGGEELTENKADAGFSLESVDPFKRGTSGTVTLRVGRDPETNCYVLDVRPKGGTQQTVYLDPRTYLIRKFISRRGGIASTITILAYQTAFGQRIPSHLQIEYGGLPLAIDATLQKAVKLPTVAASLFTPPKPPKDWEFLAPGGPKEATIPFTTEDNEIILPASVNGHLLRLLLDSGAGSSFVTAQGAKTAGLTTQGELPAIGYGGSSATGIATNAVIQIGDGVRLNGQSLHVIKDPNVAKLLNDRGHVDGAIGYELFTRFVVRIDYANKTLTLTDAAAPLPTIDAATVTLPLKLENRMPTVLASVDGHKPGRFIVDTGDSGAVHLYTQYAQANGLMPKPNDPQAQTRIGGGVGGSITETSTPGHTLKLGSATLTDLSLATMDGPGITRISMEAGGIGNLVLRQYVVTFDYAHEQMRLETPIGTPLPRAARVLPPVREEPGVLVSSYPSLTGRGGEPQRAGVGSHAGLGPRFILADAVIPSMTLETLLGKHLESLGGEDAVTAIKSTKITASVQTGGIRGVITTIYAAPDKEYEEDKLGILDILQGYDGKTAWQRDTNGNVRPLAGEELKDLRVQLFFDTNSYVLPGRISGKMTLRTETEPGTGDYIVDALPEGGKPTTLYFDPHTFFIVKEQHLDDNIQVTTTYSDYRTVDGVRFPFQTTTTNGTARYDVVGTVTKLENNVAVLPTLFTPPTGGNKFSFIHPNLSRASVPFDMDDGEIGFDVRINGQPERVFLDSGASGIALSQETATQLGLKTSGYLEARGYGGSTDLRPILINHFEVPGAVQLSEVTAIAIDLPDTLNSFFTRPLAGFVGYDLLAHFVVRVDFPKRQLTFINAETFQPTAADGTVLPIELDNDVPSVQARLDMLPPARYLIDTGDDAAIRLYSPFIAQYGLDKKYPHGAIKTGGGIGGVSRSRVTRIGSFSVAGITFNALPTDFSLDPKGGASLINAGSLGTALLSRFVVTFDYPHNRVFFAPTANIRAAFVTRTTGLTLMETKDPQGHSHVIVGEILPHAPANSSGLNVYDEVLAIDGQRTAQIGLNGAKRLLSSAAGGQTHTLLVQSTIGKPRTVTIPLFDPLR